MQLKECYVSAVYVCSCCILLSSYCLLMCDANLRYVIFCIILNNLQLTEMIKRRRKLYLPLHHLTTGEKRKGKTWIYVAWMNIILASDKCEIHKIPKKALCNVCLFEVLHIHIWVFKSLRNFTITFVKEINKFKICTLFGLFVLCFIYMFFYTRWSKKKISKRKVFSKLILHCVEE